eukprot:1865153-Rhodomonas_salina.1
MAHAFETQCWEPAVHNVKSVMCVDMCAVRFEQQVRGHAVLNSMMQLPQSAGQRQYVTEFEVQQQMEVEGGGGGGGLPASTRPSVSLRPRVVAGG